MTEHLALRFLEEFSLLTVGESKRPNFSWSQNQSEKLNIDEFKKRFNYKGGITKKDGEPLQPTTAVGIITGFEDLEVIDVDLKVFSTTSEKNEFWNEYVETLRENIYDFDKKFSIYKTVSGGYHILYKSKRVQGNTKVAVLKGHKQAVIESRGIGGYVFIYPESKQGELSYFNIQYITDADRETLWNISKAYNHEEPKPEKIPAKTTKQFKSEGKTPWEDFNEQVSVLDIVVPDDFIIPRGGHKSKYTLVKRHGSEAAHSGYVFTDSGCMYLFTTGTQYPHETLISPFAAYTYKNHNGDFSAAASELYSQGFGERVKVEELKPLVIDKPVIPTAEFPIDIFPDEVQFYIKECADKLQMNVDYMGCALLWLISVICGNSFEIEVKRGWKEKGILWLALVGQAGIGKTPSIESIIFPLSKINNREIKRYLEERKKFDEFNKLSKKEQKDLYGELYTVEEPKKTQFIVNDITLEALVQMHQESDNAVGVFKDELAGWLKDMNKYRAGSDLEFWLSTWSGKSVNVNRMTRAGSFVDKPFIPVLGGIQPTIFNNLSTEETKDNGFLDRLLLAFPDAKVEHYTDSEISYESIEWFSEVVTKFYHRVKNTIDRKDGEIVPRTLKLSAMGQKEWIRMFNDITDKQNDDEENQYLKSMYPKQKSYIPRFALLIRVFKTFFEDFKGVEVVDADAMLKAEKLSSYFVNNAKKVKIENAETNDIKKLMASEKTNLDKIKAIYEQDPDFNRTKVAELVGISRQMVYKIIKQLEG
jgi:hypothetical protein